MASGIDICHVTINLLLNFNGTVQHSDTLRLRLLKNVPHNVGAAETHTFKERNVAETHMSLFTMWARPN
jgi:hypothetical protein